MRHAKNENGHMPGTEEMLKSVRETLAETGGIQQRHSSMIAGYQQLLEAARVAVARHERWLAEQEHTIALQNESLAEHRAATRRLEQLMKHLVEGKRMSGREDRAKPARVDTESVQEKKILREQLKLREDIVRIYTRLESLELDITKLKARYRNRGPIALHVLRKEQS